MITSVFTGRYNAALIEYIRPLYLAPDAVVLDATYGRGSWWKTYEPWTLVTNDMDPTKSAQWQFDFRALPDVWADLYDVVAFDPPYVCKGGHATSGIAEFDDRFGLRNAPRTPQALWDMIGEGVGECARVLAPGGYLLYKTADYIYGGKYRFGLGEATAHLRRAGLELVDLFIHVTGVGPQPAGRRVVHSRREHSYLVIGKKA